MYWPPPLARHIGVGDEILTAYFQGLQMRKSLGIVVVVPQTSDLRSVVGNVHYSCLSEYISSPQIWKLSFLLKSLQKRQTLPNGTTSCPKVVLTAHCGVLLQVLVPSIRRSWCLDRGLGASTEVFGADDPESLALDQGLRPPPAHYAEIGTFARKEAPALLNV